MADPSSVLPAGGPHAAVTVAEARATLLIQAGEALAASLEYATTLQTVAALAVQGFADSCFVDILNADGTAERLAVDHRDPARAGSPRISRHGDRACGAARDHGRRGAGPGRASLSRCRRKVK